MQAEKKVQWQAEGEGDIAAMKEEVKKEEEEEEESEEEGEEITGGLLPQDLSKLDVSSLTPLTPEVIRCAAYFFFASCPRARHLISANDACTTRQPLAVEPRIRNMTGCVQIYERAEPCTVCCRGGHKCRRPACVA